MNQKALRSTVMPVAWVMALLILSACMNERSAQIPSNAVLETNGTDHLTFTSPSDGMVWVYDANRDRILYSGSVVSNDTIALDPEADNVTVSGRTVAEKTMTRGDAHRIFFQPASAAPARY